MLPAIRFRIPRRALPAAMLFVIVCSRAGLAIPPAPANDDPINAAPIGPDVPVIVRGTTVLANDSISTTPLPPPVADVDGPDVYYRFAPLDSGVYRVQLLPWDLAPLRSSDRRFILYVFEEEYLAGAEAPGNARAVHVDVNLTVGLTYTIGVDYDAATHDNFPFTLIVDKLSGANPDACASAAALSLVLPTAILSDIDAALADYTFSQSGGQCSVSGTAPATAPGNDHVYTFTPTVAGEYAFELVGAGFDAVLYIDDTCPPNFADGCLGASNHSTGGSSGGKHELVVVSLDADTDYYVFVDNNTTNLLTGNYALIVDSAFAYQINEIEPNDGASTASELETPLNGGQLAGPLDEDWWALPGSTGDRVYAWANNGGSSNSTLDTDLGFYAADGSTLIEFDDEDGDGANAPIEDLRFIYATSSPVIAGARMTSDDTHYLRVTDQSATGTVHRYRFHVGVEPGTRTPTPECEPNDALAGADAGAKHYYAGVIDAPGDVDTFAFEAEIGNRVFVAADGDPERNSSGFESPNTDPKAFHAKLVVVDPEGDVLISDISDSNSIQSGPDYPAQGGFFVARTPGTHYVRVSAQSSASQIGAEETYELAIFLNDAAPDLAEDVDPEATLDPDFAGNTIAVEAIDKNAGASGICGAELVDSTNLQLTNVNFTPGDPVANFTVALIDGNDSGFAKLRVSDCAGNTTCNVAKIDVHPPICTGFNFSNRSPQSLHAPIHVPDNQPAGPGIDGEIEIAESGPVTDVNVTITIETIRPPDMDVFLESPLGTRVELITDRGTSLEFDIIDATFDDDAGEIMPILSGDSPYTGSWLPEDPQGLAKLNGEEASGVWQLNVIDDSSSASGGARLARWSLDLNAGFAGPETFSGTVEDTQGFDCGIASIALEDAVNVQLELPDDFLPGDPVVDYLVALVNPSVDGSCRVTVTDLAENVCESMVNLSGLPDVTPPANDGEVTTDLTFGDEVQVELIGDDASGVVSVVSVPDTGVVGEVEVDLTVDTKDLGRIASTLTHGGAFASLVNRVGMDDRGSVGLTKDIIDITLDDDAPPVDDAHEEPANGSIEFFGPHQPDARGDVIGDGITSDDRDHFMFRLAGQEMSGDWELYVADFREQGAGSARSTFRRWSMTVKSPCGPERFVGSTLDLAPGAGICSIALTANDNLQLEADFTPGDQVVEYVVSLADPTMDGAGQVRVDDCADNVTDLLVELLGSTGDDHLPVCGGAVNQLTSDFEGIATESAPGDTGIVEVATAPFADNLQLVSVSPDPPTGDQQVEFVVGLIDPNVNGRGYVRVTDACGLRCFTLVEIDASGPMCTGSVGRTKRYRSGNELPAELPQSNPSGVISTIDVPDTDIVSDLNITFNITHPFDDDIDMALTSPTFINLFSDIGSTGNDFLDTTLDDEADAPIPDSSSAAPFTGPHQPEGGPALFALDGGSAAGAYSLRVADDANFNVGVFESWSVTIESETFAERFDGRTEDNRAHDSGMCSIALAPGAVNLTLTTDSFAEGDSIVRYSVELCGASGAGGVGTVRITDCAGNSCDVPISLNASGATGDMDGDGDVDLHDYELFQGCINGPNSQPYACDDTCSAADFNGDGDVDFGDFAGLQLVFSGDP